MLISQPSNRMKEVSSFHVMDVMTRAKKMEAAGHDIVHMEVGEPDFSTTQPIVDAGIEFLQQAVVHYTEAQGLPALRQKISDFYLQQYGVSVAIDRVFITPGASGALTVALAMLLDKGDEVLMPDPGYPCNSNLTTLFGGQPKIVSVDAEDNFQWTREKVLSHWSDSTKGLMVASPSNPTGTLISAERLSDLVETVKEKGGFLISDEIYHGLTYEQRANSALEYSDDVFILNSFSKFFGMTGWRLGWLIVPEQAISAATRLMQNLYISSPTHSQYAALAAFEDDAQAVLLARRDEFKARRDVLFQGLEELGFVIEHKPQGAFYIYADCSAFTDDSYAFALELLEQQGVAVTPGIDFGRNKPERYLRFAYTTSRQQIELGLTRIKAFLVSKGLV